MQMWDRPIAPNILSIRKSIIEKSKSPYRKFAFLLSFLPSLLICYLELFLHELCLIYYFISDEKLDLLDVIIYDSNAKISRQNAIAGEVSQDIASAHSTVNDYADIATTSHTTVDFERNMLDYIKNGDIDGLHEFFKTNSSGQAGMTPFYMLRKIITHLPHLLIYP